MSLKWQLYFLLNVHAERGDKDFVIIHKIKAEITNERLRQSRMIDESPFRKPVTDNSANNLKRLKALVDAERKREGDLIELALDE